jgi:hypothetical protein
MIEVGDTVQIGETGGSRDSDEGRAVIESVDEGAAGKYPFSMPLVAVDVQE